MLQGRQAVAGNKQLNAHMICLRFSSLRFRSVTQSATNIFTVNPPSYTKCNSYLLCELDERLWRERRNTGTRQVGRVMRKNIRLQTQQPNRIPQSRNQVDCEGNWTELNRKSTILKHPLKKENMGLTAFYLCWRIRSLEVCLSGECS